MAGGHPNVYLYCANDPVNSKDPSGLQEEDIFTQVGVREDRMGGRNGLGAARGKRAVAQVKNLAQTALELNPIEQARIAASGTDCWGQEVSGFSRAFAVLGIIPGLGSGVRLVPKLAKLSFSTTQLQAKFKHAKQFGINQNWNKHAGATFEAALRSHCNDTGTIVIEGAYRATQKVFHYYNPNTGLNVMFDLRGSFLSAWELSQEQIGWLLRTGNIQ